MHLTFPPLDLRKSSNTKVPRNHRKKMIQKADIRDSSEERSQMKNPLIRIFRKVLVMTSKLVQNERWKLMKNLFRWPTCVKAWQRKYVDITRHAGNEWKEVFRWLTIIVWHHKIYIYIYIYAVARKGGLEWMRASVLDGAGNGRCTYITYERKASFFFFF